MKERIKYFLLFFIPFVFGLLDPDKAIRIGIVGLVIVIDVRIDI